MAAAPRLSAHLRIRHNVRPVRVAAAIAATAAVVSLVVAAVGPAGAATTQTWNRLAGCESGGDWHINSGNGYYGGLQFSEPTWTAMGGKKYAARPDLATPAQQMAVGNALLRADDWSWEAWPACSSRLGLTREQAMQMDQSVEGHFVHLHTYQPDHRVPHARLQRRLDLK